MIEKRPAGPDIDDLLYVRDLAEKFKSTESGIYNMRHEGKLPPAYKFGSRLVWSRAEVSAWLATTRDEPREPVA